MEEHVQTNSNIAFGSEYKGKIALVGIAGLYTAGAVAAYVLAYPLVAIALTIAAAILMVIGVAKVLENLNVEKPFAQQLGDR